MVLALAANVIVDRGATQEFSSPNLDAAKDKNVVTPSLDSAAQQPPIQATDTTKK
jgi:hypothetical protein